MRSWAHRRQTPVESVAAGDRIPHGGCSIFAHWRELLLGRCQRGRRSCRGRRASSPGAGGAASPGRRRVPPGQRGGWLCRVSPGQHRSWRRRASPGRHRSQQGRAEPGRRGSWGAGSRRGGTGAGGAEPRRDCSWPVRHGEEQREKLETDSSSHDLSGAGGGKEKKTDGGWGNRRRAEKSDGVGESLGAVRSGAGWLGC